jgi:hypothetical protein
MPGGAVLLFQKGEVMAEINLDPKKLLGFKIIANGESNATLRSPKIGVKGCNVAGAMPASAGTSAATKI